MEEWVLKSILSIGTQFKGAKEVVRQEQRVVSSNTNTNQPSNYTEHNSSANFERTNSNANSMDKTIMDEQLISEVQQHAIIYNRQKSSVFTGDKCVTKELAWQDVARNLTSDVDTCKKRWKYLRERYVQQKKSGGSPHYEHLSRPYLEKMKFLDNFIQSRKSYRQIGGFPLPTTPNQSYDVNDNSSRSNSSIRLNGTNSSHTDADAQYYFNQLSNVMPMVKSEDDGILLQSSSSSSIVSQESPLTLLSISSTHDNDDKEPNNKRRRTISASFSDRNTSHTVNNHTEHDQKRPHLNNMSDHEDDNNSINETERTPANNNNNNNISNNMANDFLYNSLYEENSRARRSLNDSLPMQTFPNASDILHPLYQQMLGRQLRSSEHLLGELVTSELIKMPRDRKKIVQKKILEVLFFDED